MMQQAAFNFRFSSDELDEALEAAPAFHFHGAGRRTLVPPGIPSNRRTRVTDTRRCNRPNLAVCALNAMRRARQSEGLVKIT